MHTKLENSNNLVYETFYLNSASMEIIGNRELTYVYAGGTPFAIHEKDGNDEQLYYLHLDYQGSIRAITDEAGAVVETRDYDAWGRPRNPNTLEYTATNPFSVSTITNRGYTFHVRETWLLNKSLSRTIPLCGKHIFEFSLINMNARMYDPVLRRVISPDNLIPEPDNTQAYNRYTYCYNNPLKYIDPDGNEPITALAIWVCVKLIKVAAKVAAKKLVSTKVAKYTTATAKFTKSKAFGNSVSGITNAMNNTENQNGWGWEAAGHFLAGYAGSMMGEVSGYTAFVTAGGLTMMTDAIAGDIEDGYDMAQSFVGGGLSGLVGKNINKKITGGPKTFWDKWYGKGIAFGNEAVAKSFAYDDEDKFFDKHWTVHAGTWASGFANGALVGAFDANKKDLFEEIRVDDNKFGQAGIEFAVRGIGFGGEFIGTAFAKSQYGKKPMNWDSFGKKLRNSSPKNMGYLLITYFK